MGGEEEREEREGVRAPLMRMPSLPFREDVNDDDNSNDGHAGRTVQRQESARTTGRETKKKDENSFLASKVLAEAAWLSSTVGNAEGTPTSPSQLGGAPLLPARVVLLGERDGRVPLLLGERESVAMIRWVER